MWELAPTLEGVHEQWEQIQKCRAEARQRHLRWFAKNDLFFLGRYILGWGPTKQGPYADHPWQFARAREVQKDPDRVLDLWSRGHMKSHWKTTALSIQNILNDPNIAICIFSHTRPVAKAFLRVIKMIFETNTELRRLFPDIIWEKTDAAPKWSEDDGICVKRNVVRLEQTVEAYGLVDGQPTSRHYDILLYDDVVTLESVTSAEMMQKTTDAWGVSLNLAMPDTKVRLNGTFYHESDTYHAIKDRGIRVRRYPIFELDDNGKPLEDRPVFFTMEQVEEKRKQGVRNFAFQCLLDERLDTTQQRWQREWIEKYSHKINLGVNVYILVDPANEQRKHSDYTVMAVIGLGADHNYYVLDLIRDRLNLKQRTEALFGLHQKYMQRGAGMRPQNVGYEAYGKDSDIQHIQEKMDGLNYHFAITPLAGRLSKKDRINKLQPLFEEHRWWFPDRIYRTDYEHKQVELVTAFINEEYLLWPNPKHDDILDCLARILDPKFPTTFPVGDYVGAVKDYPEIYPERPLSWQSA